MFLSGVNQRPSVLRIELSPDTLCRERNWLCRGTVRKSLPRQQRPTDSTLPLYGQLSESTMPPRGNEGFDFTPILTHYLFLFTTLLAVASIFGILSGFKFHRDAQIGWFTAFISLCIATAQSKFLPRHW
jgi:hypothetical protein